MKAIYIRASTKEQEPENQIAAIEQLSGKEYSLFQDKQTAWRESQEREEFEKLKKEIKSKHISDLYVWDLDRIYRNRKNLIAFFEFCRIYQCKVHSSRQQWLEQLINLPEPFNEIMFSFFLQLLGWMAEDESTQKSRRIKAAVRKQGNKTLSYKGNKWGRKTLSTYKINEIRALSAQNMTIRQIASTSGLSIGVVHKYITGLKRNSEQKGEVHNLTDL